MISLHRQPSRCVSQGICSKTFKSSMVSKMRCMYSGPERSVVARFKFLKDLGIKKPDFLPDFGGPKKARLAAEFVEGGMPESGRAPGFAVTVNGSPVSGADLDAAVAAVKGATDFDAKPYDEETLERVITFNANGKACQLRMTQEGKVMSATL